MFCAQHRNWSWLCFGAFGGPKRHFNDCKGFFVSGCHDALCWSHVLFLFLWDSIHSKMRFTFTWFHKAWAEDWLTRYVFFLWWQHVQTECVKPLGKLFFRRHSDVTGQTCQKLIWWISHKLQCFFLKKIPTSLGVVYLIHPTILYFGLSPQ